MFHPRMENILNKPIKKMLRNVFVPDHPTGPKSKDIRYLSVSITIIDNKTSWP